MSQGWIYLVVAALHLPAIAIFGLILRDLADSDPPEPPDGWHGPGGGPPPGWRWRRPRRGGPRPAQAARTRGRPVRGR